MSTESCQTSPRSDPCLFLAPLTEQGRDADTAEERKIINVIQIVDRPNIGGPTKLVTWLAAGLNPEQFKAMVVTGTVPSGEGDMTYFLREAGVDPVVIPAMSRELSVRDIFVVFKLLGWFRKVRPQVIHTHKAKAGAVGRVAAMLYRWLTPSALWLRPRQCRVVHTYHGHVFHSYFGRLQTRLILACERFLAWMCTDRIIAISPQQRQEIAERFRVGRPDQYRIVPVGIDAEERTTNVSTLRHEFGIGPSETVIGIVGRLSEVKNHALFLEAAAVLMRDHGQARQIRFVIVGDGHLRPELEKLTQELGLGERVIFTGFRKDVLALYEDLDVVALTSRNEGTPLTLIEAMSRGRSVVATKVGGIVDMLGVHVGEQDGFEIWDHGIAAPAGDAHALARAFRFLGSRPDLRARMGAKAQRFVRAHWSKERLVSDTEALYRELVRTGQPATVPPP